MPDIVPVTAARRIALAALTLGLTACTQMTKHSNTLVFGTNTSIGVNVGTNAAQTPTIQIGIQRQEVAIVPLLANTTTVTGGDLGPCSTSIPDCKFVATHNSADADSYSTIASFGGEAGSEVDAGGKAGGKVKIAQYFATGIAAQYLAISGGANIVSAGGDTGAKADAAETASKLLVARTAAAKQYASAKMVALGVMGGDPTVALDVKSANYKTLETKMGGGCDEVTIERTSAFKKTKKTKLSASGWTIGEYLDFIETARPYCFDPLMPKG